MPGSLFTDGCCRRRTELSIWFVLMGSRSMKVLWILLSVVFNVSMSASSTIGQAPTQFVSQPQAGTPEVLGNAKVLICNATGSPSPSYRWLKDGRTLNPQASARIAVEATALRLRSIQRSDAGRYQCIAANSHGALLSSSAHLQVAYIRPLANVGNANKFVNLGRAVVIDLPPIDCYPAPSVEWYDGGGTRVSYESSLYHVTLRHQLVILDARPNLDGKVFKATATNVISQQTTDSQLFIVKIENVGSSVGDVAPEIVVPPVDTVVVSGSDDMVRLECVANARPLSHLSIRWSRRLHLFGQWEIIPAADEVKFQLSPFGRILTILKPNPSDAGIYQCEASLRRPTTTSSSGQVVTAEATLTVHVKPSIVLSAPQQIQVEMEATVSLPCQASGSPKPSIAWYYNGELVNPPKYAVAANGSLVIWNALVVQSGVYQCFATSETGEINSVTVLSVTSFLPELVTVPQNQTVVISGDSVTLPCSASGAPKPSIAWSKVSAAMATREPVGSVRQSPNDLVLTSVSISDTGIYTCTATNSRGTTEVTVSLQVAIRTRIVTPPHDISVRRGSDVMLSCGVVSDTQFAVSWQWSFNGVPLDMTDVRHRQRMPDGSLHIRSSDGSDIGVYVCQVVSLGGNDSATARLNVVELPHQPTLISVQLNDRPETSANLRWTSPVFDGNSEIRKFIIYLRLINSEGDDSRASGSEVNEEWRVSGYVSGHDSTEYTVHQLRPSQSYQFCVSAVNEVGEGRRSLPSASLTVPPQAPSGPPRGVVGSPRSNSSIILHWQPPEKLHWNGPLLGYQISHKPSGYPDSALSFENVTQPSKNFAEIGHLEPFQEYDIAIAAYNFKGVGVFSTYTKVRTQEGRPVAPPTDVEAVPLNSTSLRISWTPPHQRHINGINQGYKVTMTPAGDDYGDATEVVHIFMSNTSNMIGRQSSHVTGLKKFTKYSISILCFTSKGDGPNSQPITTQTLEDVPDQVGSLTVSSKIDTHIDIFWTPPQKPNGLITGYVVKCRGMNQSDWMVRVDLPASANNFTISELTARTVYHVDVAARTRVGIGESYLVVVETGVAPERPETPLSVAVTLIEATSVELQLVPSTSDDSSTVHWIIEGEHRQFPSDISHWRAFPVSRGSASTFLLVSGFQPDTEYRLRVSAENVAGRSAASDPTDWFRTASSAPSFPPEKVVVRPLNATAVVVTWTPLPQSQWNGQGRRYILRYWPCPAVNEDEERLIVSTTDDVVSLTVAGLEEWTVYCVQLTSCNERGCAEYGGNIVSVRTLESVPSSGPVNVTAQTVNSTTIRLSWSDVLEVHRNGQILGYKVFSRSTVDAAGFVQTTSVSRSHRSLLLTDLEKFTWYQMTVAAFTRSGDGPSSSPIATTQTLDDVPGVPSGVYFPEVSESSVRIAWLPPSRPNGVITGYRVAYGRKNQNTVLSVVDESLGRERTDYLVKDLDADAFYVFAVAARSRRGWGESAEVEVFTTSLRRVADPPSRPSVGLSQIGSRWAVVTLSPEPSSSSYAPNRNYTIQVQLDGGQFLTQAEFILHDATKYNITGLVPYSRYLLRLAASNDIGMSEFSETSDPFHTHPTLPDHPPTDVTVIQQSSATALVRWKPPNDSGMWNGDKVGYKVWYRQLTSSDDIDNTDKTGDSYDNEDAYLTVTTVYPHTNVLLSDLIPKVIVEVKVAAVNHVGHGPMSDPVDLFICEAAPFLVPKDLRASAVGRTSILVMWKRIEARDWEDSTVDSYLGYKVFFWISGKRGNTTRVKSLSLADNQTIVSELRIYTEYAFVVAAFGSGGSGPNSSVPVLTRTLDGTPGPPEQLTIFITSQSSVNLTWEPPSEPNGVIEGYELTYFQEALVDGESKSVHVLLSGEKTTYHARDLVPETSYTFRLNAKTRHGSGAESVQTISIGPQPGSPAPPDRLEASESALGLMVTWNTPSETGSSSLTSYILQYRQSEVNPTTSTDWTSVAVPASPSLGSLGLNVTISSQQLVPGAIYQFRVFAVNSHGISVASPTSECRYSAAELAGQTEPSTTAPFYRKWWFLLAMAIAGLAIILAIVTSLCITGRKRTKSNCKDKLTKRRNGDTKTVQPQIMSIDDETGFATIERRYPQSWGGQKYPKASTLPLYTRAPPRPSPNSIMYDIELISQHEDSGNVSDKASQNGESDGEAEDHLAAFLNHASKRPQSFCATNIDETPYPPYTISLNGGHSVMPKYQTMRAPKLSSFV